MDTINFSLFQLADSLPIKTVAERGPASRQRHAKSKKSKKRKALHKLSESAGASVSKRARIDDAVGGVGDANDISGPSSVPLESTPVDTQSTSVKVWSAFVILVWRNVENRHRSQRRGTQFTCFMRVSLQTQMGASSRQATSTTNATTVIERSRRSHGR